MGFLARVKKLTSYVYSPTNPASEDAIRTQIDDSIQEVYDNVQSGFSATDGASLVGYSGGYADVEEALQAFESGGSGTIPPDGSITNGKLATDVKVGSLASLNTTVKTDVVSAINEVDGNVDTNATDIDNLQNTIDYSTTVSGIDALTITTVNGGFTFAVGKSVRGIAVANNTGAMTANVDGDGAKAIKRLDGSSYVAVEADVFEDNKPFELIGQNDGTDFFLLAPKGGANDLSKVLAQAYNIGSIITPALTSVLSVVGSGWIHSFGTMDTLTFEHRIKIDGDNGEKFSGATNGAIGTASAPCDIRYETGFEFETGASVYYISYSEDDGSGNPKKSTPKCFYVVGSGSSSLRQTIVGSGFVNLLKGLSTRTIKIECDGVLVFNGDFRAITMKTKWRFNSELKIYSEDTTSAYQVVQYELDI